MSFWADSFEIIHFSRFETKKMNRNVRDIGQKNVQTREPPLFIFRLQITKIFKENDISFGHQSTAVANIEREESEQG